MIILIGLKKDVSINYINISNLNLFACKKNIPKIVKEKKDFNYKIQR